MAAFVDPDNPSMRNMKAVMRETQLRMPPPKAPETTQPVRYLAPGPRPFGTATLSADPNISMAALLVRKHVEANGDSNQLENALQLLTLASAPWELAPKDKDQPSLLNPLFGFNYHKFCTKCGYWKKAHVKEEGFGQKCKRNYCAKCHRLDKFHEESDGKMGPHCKAAADLVVHDSPHRHWYRVPEQTKPPRAKRKVPHESPATNNKLPTAHASATTLPASRPGPPALETTINAPLRDQVPGSHQQAVSSTLWIGVIFHQGIHFT